MIVLVTGGTGTFGQAFVKRVLNWEEFPDPRWTARVYSRDEFKQGVMRDELVAERVANSGGPLGTSTRFLLGDVRDRVRLGRAVRGCDLVVHAAALKQVTSCEYNPDECVKTNVLGSMNVVEACLDAGVPKAILLSSDKAVHPVNVYGASKLCAEKVWLASNALGDTALSAVRYGNVRGSRGSVLDRAGKDRVRITDPRATRFWMDVAQAVDLVLLAFGKMAGGEVFVPKLSSSLVLHEFDFDEHPGTGLRPGEKLHEVLISDEEVRRTYDCGDHYRICDYWPEGGVKMAEGFSYTSKVMCQ